MSQAQGSYYLPEPSHWPLVGSVGLITLLAGFAHFLHGGNPAFMYVGAAILLFMMFGWFGKVVGESQKGLYNEQVDRSFRWGMSWFIFSEVMFFAAFFGALFYVRHFSVPWLGGEGAKGAAHQLWGHFQATWPLLHTPLEAIKPEQSTFATPHSVMDTWGIPAINTLILLSSGVTVTWAHWGLKKNNRAQLILGLALTVALGILFLALQAHEYGEAYEHFNMKLTSGVYGSTFFMLTGFHGLHVTIGAIMLSVMLVRSIKGHFTPKHHFAFEAAAWYWHFVDVVWLGLFIFVYWL